MTDLEPDTPPSQGNWLLHGAAASSLGRMLIPLAKREGVKTINIVRRNEHVQELTALGCAPLKPLHAMIPGLASPADEQLLATCEPVPCVEYCMCRGSLSGVSETNMALSAMEQTVCSQVRTRLSTCHLCHFCGFQRNEVLSRRTDELPVSMSQRGCSDQLRRRLCAN